MTIEVLKPTATHTYRYYQIVKGKRVLLGTNTTAKWSLSDKQAKPNHSFVVTATDQAGKTSDASTVLKT